MGIVFGTYFGIWALFSLVVRFLVPSPKIETTLPTYTPSPIPIPVVLHSPGRPNAVPTSPAIRLHPAGSVVAPVTSAGELSGSRHTPRVTITAPGGTGQRSARFVDDGEDTDSDMNSSRYSPSISTSRTQQSNVTFQTRPRGYTTDSAHSAEFPTFAAYRQSQHGNFEALAQRFKKAFALSQQTNEQHQQQQQMAMMQSPTPGDSSLSMSTDPPSYSQITVDLAISSPTVIPLTATAATAETTGSLGTGVQSRSRSASAASMFSDIAGRLRSGSLFSRSNHNTANNNTATTILPATRAATDQPHYTHRSSSANSESTRSNVLSTPSDSAPHSSYPSSPASHTATPSMDADCVTTTVSPETMPTLEPLLSQSPISPTGHDRMLSSTSSSQTLHDRQQQNPLVHDSNINDDGDDDVAEKHTEKST
ncbi:hypothetical protein BGZ96_000259 [Linnemannia gamsii]|uniref:Transmembrane protein n=1 Tax=Linnemannia gamsii TaxID=64522 RepID=A0ABQ7JPM8_9FUNG|nr:hypothetical protein BGZ96_000259 [Linnemannia gamsii]